MGTCGGEQCTGTVKYTNSRKGDRACFGVARGTRNIPTTDYALDYSYGPKRRSNEGMPNEININEQQPRVQMRQLVTRQFQFMSRNFHLRKAVAARKIAVACSSGSPSVSLQ
jgi:hypothetical protein